MQIWERQRRIPSTTYTDPLGKLFNEFDVDGDGHLTAQEIADALLCVILYLSMQALACSPFRLVLAVAAGTVVWRPIRPRSPERSHQFDSGLV